VSQRKLSQTRTTTSAKRLFFTDCFADSGFRTDDVLTNARFQGVYPLVTIIHTVEGRGSVRNSETPWLLWPSCCRAQVLMFDSPPKSPIAAPIHVRGTRLKLTQCRHEGEKVHRFTPGTGVNCLIGRQTVEVAYYIAPAPDRP
jgi:hypothetical protein